MIKQLGTNLLPQRLGLSPVTTSRRDTRDRSPRVLFVDQTAQLGGAELCLRDVATRRDSQDRVVLFEHGPLYDLLRQDGLDVVVCPMNQWSSSVAKDSGLSRQLLSGACQLDLVRRVARVAAPFDAIYANTAKAFVVSSLAGWLSNRPVIYHLHDILSRQHFSRANLRVLVALANRLATNVIANSHATADAFAAAGGRRDKLSVIYNGFDCRASTQPACGHEGGRFLRSALGIGDSPIVSVFGRLAPWKGQHVAVEAIRFVPGAHLLLVGDSLFGEQDYVSFLREKVAQHRLEERVHFLGFRNDVSELMNLADVIVHCSTAPEPFGRVIVEALLVARPVIASNAGGATEILSHQKTGLLTTPGDPKALATAMSHLLQNRTLAQSLAAAGRDDARQRFDIEETVKATNAVIDSSTRSKGVEV